MKTGSELGITLMSSKGLNKDVGRTRVFRTSQWGSAREVILNCQRARDNRCYQTANGNVIMLAVLEPPGQRKNGGVGDVVRQKTGHDNMASW